MSTNIRDPGSATIMHYYEFGFVGLSFLSWLAEKLTDRDKFMSAEEAREFGMVDAVLAHQSSPPDSSSNGDGSEDKVPQVAS